jgi:hypothetical protein
MWCKPPSWRGVLDTTSCDKVCQWLATGRWFSPGTLISCTNKTDPNDITEILLKVALNTITLTLFVLWYHIFIDINILVHLYIVGIDCFKPANGETAVIHTKHNIPVDVSLPLLKRESSKSGKYRYSESMCFLQSKGKKNVHVFPLTLQTLILCTYLLSFNQYLYIHCILMLNTYPFKTLLHGLGEEKNTCVSANML